MDSTSRIVSIHDPFFRFTQFWVQYLFYTKLHKTQYFIRTKQFQPTCLYVMLRNAFILEWTIICTILVILESNLPLHVQRYRSSTPPDGVMLRSYTINRLLNQSISYSNRRHNSRRCDLTCVVHHSLIFSYVFRRLVRSWFDRYCCMLVMISCSPYTQMPCGIC